jgi:probable DNA repair protein
VLTGNERAARAIAAEIHAARRAEGRFAWATPAAANWDGWVRDEWLQRNDAGRMLLNPLQERALWTEVIQASEAGNGLLHPERLATAAQRAYRLLADYAPEMLTATRHDWSGDAAIFSQWLEEFEQHCRREGLISSAHLGLELTGMLESEAEEKDERPALLLVGFDRLLETQKRLLNAWGRWELDGAAPRAEAARFYAAGDAGSELRACVRWVRQRLTEKPAARLMLVANGLDAQRGEIERALLEGDAGIAFEFSLGVPLGQVSVARSALLLLRWLAEPLSEAEVDWLIACGHMAASAEEEIALAQAMRAIREAGLERTEWRLEAFLGRERDGEALHPKEDWDERMRAASRQLREAPARQSPLDWAVLAGGLLVAAGWPGFRPLGSEAFQARQRWEEMLGECATLGFDGRRVSWAEFLDSVGAALSGTVFAAESREPSLLITGPFESAGQEADGIWFLGASEQNWPGRGTPHALLPVRVQRAAKMPHATAQDDWELARTATERLMASAKTVVFSYSRTELEGEARPSRLVVRSLGAEVSLPEPMPEWLVAVADETAGLVELETIWDERPIPFPHQTLRGGASALTSQSVCPFQAFATTRLGARDWQPAEAGLNARQRGQLLHSVLHRVWKPEEGGLKDLAELQAKGDLREFVWPIARSVIREKLPPGVHGTIPARFLELEAGRLTRLVAAWLELERERLPFTVLGTEVARDVVVAGLKLRLRLDRLDEFQDGTRLIVDYKTGNVGPAAWSGDRPEDVQLPLYAVFAVEDALQGLVFARVKPGELKFEGRMRDAAATLGPMAGRTSALVKNPLDDKQLDDWFKLISRLGEDFLAGRADVDPKSTVKTCKQCGLQAVCRIAERLSDAEMAEAGEPDEDGESEGDGE